MQRLLSMCRKGALAGLALCALGRAEEPAGPPVVPQARTDPYSVYTDAYFNPHTVRPVYEPVSGHEMNHLWAGPRHRRYYGGVDALFWNRTKPANRVLVTTSYNLFDGNQNQQQATAPTGTTVTAIFPSVTDPFGNQSRGGSPNDVALRQGVPNNEFLVAGEVRMNTHDFDWPARVGYRPMVGIEFESGSKLEISYFKLMDFRSKSLVDNVAGANFDTLVISSNNPPVFAFQRFGYLNSPFRSIVAGFFGERRLQNGADPSPSPHDPGNEVPPFAGTSRDIPREPVTTDPVPTDGQPGRNGRLDDLNRNLSLLWTDGELAIADYHFGIQGGGFDYRWPAFEYCRWAWKFEAIAGIRYLNTDEMFRFFFADTLFDREAANPGNAVPGLPVPGGFVSQPADETWATIDSRIYNDVIAAEIGLDAKLPMWSIFELDLLNKIGWGPNFLGNKVSVTRGDGLLLYHYRKNDLRSTGIYEGHIGLNIKPLERLTLRGGFEYLWLINIGTATRDINYDLDRQPNPHNNDRVLFYGWYGGGEWKF